MERSLNPQRSASHDSGRGDGRDLLVVSWNLFHGRDAPPNPALFTTRSRLLRRTEDDGTYVQVNRLLYEEYATTIANARWDVCLLQECPPGWASALAQRCGAESHRVLTSRNQLGPLTRALARWNPDLVGSNEGGSNLTLVRSPWLITQRHSLLLNPLPGRGRRERRRMAFATLRGGDAELCVTNLHASANDQLLAERELLRAAEHAVEWAAQRPLILAGDFNVRPRESDLYELLEERFGLIGPTGPAAIDHMLSRDLEVSSPPQAWPEADRESIVHRGGQRRRLRLSDHAPVQAAFMVPGRPMR
ncbi:MAG: endonuclease/exonuclease/phosphatase family protein [Solirubrobacterales bacterium]